MPLSLRDVKLDCNYTTKTIAHGGRREIHGSLVMYLGPRSFGKLVHQVLRGRTVPRGTTRRTQLADPTSYLYQEGVANRGFYEPEQKQALQFM